MNTLPGNLFSPTFKKQQLGWLFTAIMAIMVYLATLAMALQASLSSTSLSWDQTQQGRFTIEFELHAEESPAVRDNQIKATVEALTKMPEIFSASVLSDSEISSLLQRWITDPDVIKALPLPKLVDVQIKPGAKITSDDLKKRIFSTAPTARVNDHADWLLQMHHAIIAVASLGWILLFLTAVALMIAINLICRAVMAVEQRTIELLHIMGATDTIIAGTFARHTYNLSWPAAVLGFSMAVFTIGGLALIVRHLTIMGETSPAMWVLPGVTLLAVPCIAVVGAIITARSAALGLLRRQL